MNLYLFATITDFSKTQLALLRQKFQKVTFLKAEETQVVIDDPAPKVLALDPDVMNWQFSNDLIAQIPELRAICLETTGYEWVDIGFCRRQNIAVCNVPHYATDAVAEKCILMALALAKKLPIFQRLGKMDWSEDLVGENLWDKPTDIIGFGAIGHALARRLLPLVGEKEICYYSRQQDDPEFHFWSFEGMLEKSEFMYITISKNPESLALFSEQNLERLNPHCKVIVVANGFEEVTARLVERCEAGKLGGVAFESNDPEILNRQYQGNVFVTPANAYYTKESLAQMFEIWTTTITSVADGSIQNQVN